MNTNKIDLIKAEVERLKSQLLRGACSSQIAMETRCKEEVYNEVLAILDSLQEEPVSNDFEMALAEMVDKAQKCIVEPWVVAAQWKDELIKLAKSEEPVSEDLGEYINELSKQFPEVSFAKLSRIAVRVAKWQKEQMMAKVIDATCFALQGAALFTFRLPAGSYLVGSKVKVIVIKED